MRRNLVTLKRMRYLPRLLPLASLSAVLVFPAPPPAAATNIVSPPIPLIPGAKIHEIGTARMGADPKRSVLNAYCQSHDVPNLFVTDGAAFASSGCQNPTLTMMANTARACEYLVEELRVGFG